MKNPRRAAIALTLIAAVAQIETAHAAEGEKQISTTIVPGGTEIAPTKDAVVGVAGRDGLYISAGQVFVSRNGSVEKVTGNYKFENGATVSPDGLFTLADGKSMRLRADQFVTFAGNIETLVRQESKVPAVVAPSAGGILLKSGKAYLVQNGRSEPLSSDFKLLNGAMAQPDGLVRMPDGTSFQLGEGQGLTFAGDLLNPGGNPSGATPVANYPRTPSAAAATGSSQATVSGALTPSPPVIQPGQGASAR